MPTQVRCKECGFILAEYDELPRNAVYGVDYLTELLRKHEGKCPKCGHMLPLRTKVPREMTVEVKDAKEKTPLMDVARRKNPRNSSCIVVKAGLTEVSRPPFSALTLPSVMG